MANKYEHLSKAAREERAKRRKCLDKRAYPTKDQAFQKGQTSYLCEHCGMWHRSGKMGKFIAQILKKNKKKPAIKPTVKKLKIVPIKLETKVLPEIKVVGIYVEKHTFVCWLYELRNKEYKRKLNYQRKMKTRVTSIHAEYNIYGYTIFDNNFKKIFSATNNRLKPETNEYVELESENAMTLDEIEAYSEKKGRELAEKKDILFIGSDFNKDSAEDHVLSYTDITKREQKLKPKVTKIKDWTILSDVEKVKGLTSLIDSATTSMNKTNENIGNISIILKLNPQLGASGVIDDYTDLHDIINQYNLKLHEIKDKLNKTK